MSWARRRPVSPTSRGRENKTLILQNVVTKKIEKRFELKTVEARVAGHQPGRQRGRFAATARRHRDIFIINLDTAQIRTSTNDNFGDYAPTYAPDGKSIVLPGAVSGNDKLSQGDLAHREENTDHVRTHDDGGAQFMDADTIGFRQAVDPNVPIEPEVARNGNITTSGH